MQEMQIFCTCKIDTFAKENKKEKFRNTDTISIEITITVLYGGIPEKEFRVEGFSSLTEGG